MSTALTDEATLGSVWRAAAGSEIDDELLKWPPDVFLLTNILLERSEAHRFALSPPDGLSWPPAHIPDWATVVADAGRGWSAWVDDPERGIPDVVAEEWAIVRDSAATPIEQLVEAGDWRLCEALLTLHAVADEACCGLGVALTAAAGEGLLYRARGRELLARTGSLARVQSDSLRVLPRVRTSPRGTSIRALSRYVGVHGSRVDVRWYKLPARRAGTEPQAQHLNFLLLPWPLRVRESDFRPIARSVRSLDNEPFGFFEFAPSERLDLDLVDRLLLAARDEVDGVDVVCLPESAVEETEVGGLEVLLKNHGVYGLITGVRERGGQPGKLRGNWVHIAALTGSEWVHMRQNKHHRWSLDEQQIYQYHLGGALHPRIRWWDAMAVPRRRVQFIEGGEGVILAALACEDLAQIDEVADVLRSVGPTMVVTPLLDGPQLSSRWAARYAGVLADDPGSAVLTLTSSGMARRSRPHGHEASPIVALWKDSLRGTHEIALEDGAQGILVTASSDLATRRSGDGRRPVQNCTEFFDVSVYQVRASSVNTKASPASRMSHIQAGDELAVEELTILVSWAEAIAEALAGAPGSLEAVINGSRPNVSWRAALGIAEPSSQLTEAIDLMNQAAQIASLAPGVENLTAAIAAVSRLQPEGLLATVAHLVLRSALEQRHMRQAKQQATPRNERLPTTASLGSGN
jgi:hypothetical protein